MSGLVRHRRRWRRLALRAATVVAFAALTATLAAGLQVHEIRVTGISRFPAAEVETALRFALGTPTVTLHAEELRQAVRALPWVAEAQVRVSIDGVVDCAVVERQPAAIAVDGSARVMVGTEGHLLGPLRGDVPPVELHGFAADPYGRAAVLATAGAVESRWGARLVRAERLGPRDVMFVFADTPCRVVADPARPEAIATARRLHAAWTDADGREPLRIDVRAASRAAVLPAPAPEEAS